MTTTITVEHDTWVRLKRIKREYGYTYNQIIRYLLDGYETTHIKPKVIKKL